MELNWPQSVPITEINEEFIQGMLNRMATSYFKYGKVSDAYPLKVNAFKSMEDRLKLYKTTKNKEYLIDAANFLMIEFMLPSIFGTFFKATDSDGSPGRVWNNGETSDKKNK
jgi:hypothetical protein